MIRSILSRLALLLGGLLVASILIFVALRIAPGDVAQVIAGSEATPAQVEAIRASLGLDRSLLTQYLEWVGGFIRGDLGRSMITGAPVIDELREKAEVTVPLTVLALGIAIIFAVPTGIIAALARRRAAGTILSIGAQLTAAVPILWAGMLLILLFSMTLGWFPPQGFPRGGWEQPGDALRALVLPALAIGLVEGALITRFVRSATLDALGQEHVLAGAARGSTRLSALLRHGLPSVGLSIVSILGVQVAGLIVGAVIVEQLFTLPGIGRMLVTDVGNRDLVAVQSELLILTAVVLIVGALVDIVHRTLDPRQRVRV